MVRSLDMRLETGLHGVSGAFLSCCVWMDLEELQRLLTMSVFWRCCAARFGIWMVGACVLYPCRSCKKTRAFHYFDVPHSLYRLNLPPLQSKRDWSICDQEWPMKWHGTTGKARLCLLNMVAGSRELVRAPLSLDTLRLRVNFDFH